ncbi:hypothetical protein QVD17_41474 [Tagetes erecta]|uniref:CCHC-type domain-containing protein n=1 Tax=Tagetes erecta TaxID=13708 RepID=A0AAD8N8V7_TARER|nr:hypothetical protein QVD17_41474 [Tagetes erecta]
MDEQSRNLMSKKEMEQNVFKGEKSRQQAHAFVSTDVNTVDEHFQGDCFFASSTDLVDLNEFCEVAAESSKGKEHKAAYAAFTASFQAYLGSQLTLMELMVQDLNDMHPDDVEDMDIQWNMVMLAYRSQRQIKSNRNFSKPSLNKKIGFDKSKVKCFKCNLYGHFSRECNNPVAKTAQNTLNPNQASSSNSKPDEPKAMCVTYDGEVDWSAYGAEIEKEFALMAQNADDDQAKGVEFDASKYPPLPKDVKENVCSKACLHEVTRYKTHSFVVNDMLQAEIKNHKKTKEEQKEFEKKIKSLTEDLKESKNQESILKNSLKILEESFVKSQLEASTYKMKYEQLMSTKEQTEKWIASQKERKNGNGLGFSQVAYKTTPPHVNYEKMPSSMTNTLPNDFNPHDYSTEAQAKLKVVQNSESSDDSECSKINKEVFIEHDTKKLEEGHPIKITSYEPKPKQVYLKTKNFNGFVKSESNPINEYSNIFVEKVKEKAELRNKCQIKMIYNDHKCEVCEGFGSRS